MKKGILKLPENRVRRNYLGGAGIDALHGKQECVDDNRPEEWVGSMVEASNPGMEQMKHEGLAVIETESGSRFLRDIVEAEKDYYLGSSIHKDGSWQLSFLLKILDSAMRLHVQAHPTTRFARNVMGKPYGKLECYYILQVRAGVDPYIRLGFQHAPTREEWREIVEQQDVERMDGCFEKIPVKPGEIWYIPGGMPHAIGEGITMLEIMEPSDLVVRCEFEREGIVVPEGGRFMGKGLDFCLDIFDYTEYSKEEIMEKCRIRPELVEQSESMERLRLVDEKRTPCFFADKLCVYQEAEVRHNRKFTLGVVCSGGCTMEYGDERISLRQGDSFMIAAAVETYRVIAEGTVELVIVYPGKDMEA
ncbi:MAG: mannose-6-phosphate isomerase [Lachnospiraceae bacterium]|nr:mannose-6-phosphate isomerase [Lachnospiraceae bacterium]